MKIKKNENLGGAAILAFANIVCRVLGFMFKIPLSNLIGSEGMGYFSLATQVFGVATFPSTGGLPTVLEKHVAFRDAKGEDTLPILKTLTPIFLLIGGASALVMGLFSKTICSVAGVEDAAMSVAVLAPGVLFVTAEAMYRTYFHGRSMLGPGALAQTCEAAAKLAVGTGAAFFLYKNGYTPSVVASGAALGVTFGTLVAAGVLRVRLLSVGKLRRCRKESGLGKKVLAEAFPITLASGVMSVIGALDAAVILNRLSVIGNTQSSAASLYGIYTGYAVTVYALPFALTGAVSTWVSPIVSGTFATGNGEKLAYGLRRALGLVGSVGFFAATCYIAMPEKLLGIFFSRSEVDLAAPLLSLLAPSVIFAPLLSVFSVSLQAMGKTKPAIYGGIISGVVKLCLNFFLVGNPEFGIWGAPISAGVSFLLGLLITGGGVTVNVRSLGVRPRILSGLIVPLILGSSCGSISFLLCGFLASRLDPRLGTVAGLGVGICLLGVLTFLCRESGQNRDNCENVGVNNEN